MNGQVTKSKGTVLVDVCVDEKLYGKSEGGNL